MWADILVFGVVWGAIYAVLALGFSIIYGVARILNLSHGALCMASSYLIYIAIATLHWPFALAALAALVLVGGYGMAFYRGVVQPMRGSHTRVLVASAAAAILLQEIAFWVFGPEARYVPSVLQGEVLVGGVVMTYQQLATVATALIAMGAVWLFLGRTRAGRALRAVAQDPEVAALSGIHVEGTYLLAMGLSAALAAVAGVLVAPFLTVAPDMGWSPLLTAFAIVVLGGMGSIGGTVVAAFLIAFVEMVTAFYVAPQLRDAATFVVMIVALTWRPQGLFGKGVAA
jgi:branched-chain amino acid transport system permease protein